MKAIELRIGNYVWEGYGGYYQVLAIMPNSVDLVKPFMSMSGRYDIETIKPIKITKEWLFDLGFEKTELSGSIDCYLNHSIGLNTYSKTPVDYYWLKDYHNINIKYVHQLQNIYFSLTGKELLKDYTK